VAPLTTGIAAHQPVAATAFETPAAPGAGTAAIGSVCHGCDLGISKWLLHQIERDQQLPLVTLAALAPDRLAADAQSQVGLLRAGRAVRRAALLHD
jgi:hypothetical protein